MQALQFCKPEKVFAFFEDISQIPRGSGNERAISNWLVHFAHERGLWVHQDEAYNVIIKKPASAGYAHKPPIILQGHMDMVCEKNQDKIHDFTKDPITLLVEGDFIRADGTTLGADNGIALAYALALLDGAYKHPPLEVLFTTSEETGMDGAQAVNPQLLKGRRLINIDNEEEGVFISSCAGGIKTTVHLPVTFEALPTGMQLLRLRIKGLKGGHSGMEIHRQRGNANTLLGRLLYTLLKQVSFKVLKVYGGLKDNAIPREAEALIAVKAEDKAVLEALLLENQGIYAKEHRISDPSLTLELTEAQEACTQAFTQESVNRILALLSQIPNGVAAYSLELEHLVETSNNPGVLRTGDTEVLLDNAIRSSVVSQKYWMNERLRILAESLGGFIDSRGNYPAWEFNPDSSLRESFIRTYTRMYGKAPVVTAIHAGLECGIFAELIKGADMIAFGPDIFGAHTPEEKMCISSVARVWEFLLEVLADEGAVD